MAKTTCTPHTPTGDKPVQVLVFTTDFKDAMVRRTSSTANLQRLVDHIFNNAVNCTAFRRKSITLIFSTYSTIEATSKTNSPLLSGGLGNSG